eukprot:m51a1_g11232 hypothetical protein (121) ;mRNA; r:30296-34955
MEDPKIYNGVYTGSAWLAGHTNIKDTRTAPDSTIYKYSYARADKLWAKYRVFMMDDLMRTMDVPSAERAALAMIEKPLSELLNFNHEQLRAHVEHNKPLMNKKQLDFFEDMVQCVEAQPG